MSNVLATISSFSLSLTTGPVIVVLAVASGLTVTLAVASLFVPAGATLSVFGVVSSDLVGILGVLSNFGGVVNGFVACVI